jgi:hypothetical protein
MSGSGHGHGRDIQDAQAAVDAAHRGDHFTLRGVCHGGTVIYKGVVIEGAQPGPRGRAILDGDERGRVVKVERGVTVTMRDLVVSGGMSTDWSGILNRGNLVLRDVVVRKNGVARYMAYVGGVYNVGRLMLVGATRISANFGDADAGGVENKGTLILDDSASITANGSIYGGGVTNSGTMTMNDAALA